MRIRTPDEMIEICLKAGFSGIEAHDFLIHHQDEPGAEKLGEKFRSNGLKIDSFHLPYMDLAALEEAERLDALEHYKRALRKAAALGVRVAIAHATRSGNVVASGLNPLLDALEKSLAELLPLAQSLGVIIALENLPPSGIHRLASLPEHFGIFKQRFAHPSLGFCLDTGHALLSLHDRAFEFIEVMKSDLQAFHLTDNAGDRDSHLAPGRGFVDWASIAKLLQDIQFTHPACIEAPPFAYGPDYSVDAWAKLYTDTARLLPV